MSNSIVAQIKDIHVKRFEEKYQVNPETGCWEWTASRNNRGYGVIGFKGEQYLAHRFSYMIFQGAIPEGKLICHHCDNPKCVNPDHLYAGTAKDNRVDNLLRGRNTAGGPAGMGNGRAKLTDEDIALIFQLREQGYLQREIGAKLGITQAYVGKVLRGENRIDHPTAYRKHHAPDAVKPRQYESRKGLLTGSKNPQSKLTDAQVAEIRELAKTGLSQRKIGELFGVTQSNISCILLGKSRA